MENINNTIKGVKDLKYKLKVAYEEAKKDPYFKELTDSINLSDDELMKHTSLFEDSKEEYKNCKSCKNLAACKNKMTGFCFLPVLKEGRLNFSYVACKYKEKYLSDCKYQKNVTSMDVPREIREAKIKDIYTDDKQREKVIKWILNYIKEYKKGNFGKGLYLHGNFGCGKTYLISAMFNELAKKGVKSVTVYYPEFLRELKGRFGEDYNEVFNKVRKAPLLLLDDIGAETVTNWNRDEILGSLLQYRMQEGLPTFFTSNNTIKELEEHLIGSDSEGRVKSRRIIERIKYLTDEIIMVAENRRK